MKTIIARCRMGSGRASGTGPRNGRAHPAKCPPSTPALRARSASSFFGGEPSPGRPTNIVNTRLRCPGGVRRDAPAVASCRPRITHVRHGAHRRAFAVAHSACLSRPPERMWTDAACPRPPPEGGTESMTPHETGSTATPGAPSAAPPPRTFGPPGADSGGPHRRLPRRCCMNRS